MANIVAGSLVCQKHKNYVFCKLEKNVCHQNLHLSKKNSNTFFLILKKRPCGSLWSSTPVGNMLALFPKTKFLGFPFFLTILSVTGCLIKVKPFIQLKFRSVYKVPAEELLSQPHLWLK